MYHAAFFNNDLLMDLLDSSEHAGHPPVTLARFSLV